MARRGERQRPAVHRRRRALHPVRAAGARGGGAVRRAVGGARWRPHRGQRAAQRLGVPLPLQRARRARAHGLRVRAALRGRRRRQRHQRHERHQRDGASVRGGRRGAVRCAAVCGERAGGGGGGRGRGPRLAAGLAQRPAVHGADQLHVLFAARSDVALARRRPRRGRPPRARERCPLLGGARAPLGVPHPPLPLRLGGGAGLARDRRPRQRHRSGGGRALRPRRGRRRTAAGGRVLLARTDGGRRAARANLQRPRLHVVQHHVAPVRGTDRRRRRAARRAAHRRHAPANRRRAAAARRPAAAPRGQPLRLRPEYVRPQPRGRGHRARAAGGDHPGDLRRRHRRAVVPLAQRKPLGRDRRPQRLGDDEPEHGGGARRVARAARAAVVAARGRRALWLLLATRGGLALADDGPRRGRHADRRRRLLLCAVRRRAAAPVQHDVRRAAADGRAAVARAAAVACAIAGGCGSGGGAGNGADKHADHRRPPALRPRRHRRGGARDPQRLFSALRLAAARRERPRRSRRTAL